MFARAINLLDLVYRDGRESDTVYLHGLINQRMARWAPAGRPFVNVLVNGSENELRQHQVL